MAFACLKEFTYFYYSKQWRQCSLSHPFSLPYHSSLLQPRSCLQNALREKQIPIFIAHMSQNSRVPMLSMSTNSLFVVFSRFSMNQSSSANSSQSGSSQALLGTGNCSLSRSFSQCPQYDLVKNWRRKRLKHHSLRTFYTHGFSHHKELQIFSLHSLHMGDRIFRQSIQIHFSIFHVNILS